MYEEYTRLNPRPIAFTNLALRTVVFQKLTCVLCLQTYQLNCCFVLSFQDADYLPLLSVRGE